DVDLPDLRRPRRLVEARALALRASRERDGALDEGANVRLHRVDVLGQERLLDARDEPLVREVHLLELDLRRFLIEEGVPLLLRELPDRLVRIDAGRREDAHHPAVGRVAGNRERALVERLAVVEELREIDVADRSHALATRAHAAEIDDVAHDDALAL